VIKVFIADDHAIVRHGLAQLVNGSGDMTVVGEASDGRQLLMAAEARGWDVLVLDLSLPKVNGHEVLRRLHQGWPELAVLVLSAYPEDQFAERMLRDGAAAYLNKDRPADEVLVAIRRIASGRRYVTASLAEKVLQAPSRGRAPHETLTAREHQVFTLVVQGQTVTEIAAELDISASTVSNHLGKVKEKLNVHSITEIVRYAHSAGLID
jgi:DNA-binding NarL/FixJ family response regulator